MTTLEQTAAIVFVALVLPQALLTIWFAWIVNHRTRGFVARNASRQASASIPAEVLLCLRGCDETLPDVLASLAQQSHPSWRLRIIVDSEKDPAWDAAHSSISKLNAHATWTEACIEPLTARPEQGSLKCASLRQALRSLDETTDVVALIDADSVVHPDWLLTMVNECMQPDIGAVSGNRWYDPDQDTPAAIVRALWNAGAIVQMTTFGIPWGGSLAIRRKAMADCHWDDVIATTFCEDTSLAQPLARAGWKYRYIPSLTAIDRDASIRLAPLTRWIARQLLTVRLHHPSWPLVAVHGVSTSLALVVVIAGSIAALASGHHRIAIILGLFFLAYELINMALLALITYSIRQAIQTRATQPRHRTPLQILGWIASIPVTQVVYAFAVVICMCAKTIEWRGVIYDIHRSRKATSVSIRSEH